MCPPTFFDVTYSINPWMDPDKSVDADIKMAQWARLFDLYVKLGHEVEFIEPLEGLLDMVLSANGATVIDGLVLLAKFRHAERASEAAAYREWFGVRGYRKIQELQLINEGEGNYLVTSRRVLPGTGFQTDRHAHDEAQELFGYLVIGLTLVNAPFIILTRRSPCSTTTRSCTIRRRSRPAAGQC